MKKILAIILFLLPCITFAQLPYSKVYPIDSTTNKITYKGVINVAGKKADLYSKAKQWFALTYNSGKDVIQLDDPIGGKIIGKGLIVVETMSTSPRIAQFMNNVRYTITVDVKDGKYRYKVTDLNVTLRNSEPQKSLEDVLEDMAKSEETDREALALKIMPASKIKALISSLSAAMAAKNDDF